MLTLRTAALISGQRAPHGPRQHSPSRGLSGQLWVHVLVSTWYSLQFGAVATGIVWPATYLWFEVDRHGHAGGDSATVAIVLGAVVALGWLWAQLRHVGRGLRASRSWMVLHDDKPVGLLDEATFEEMQLAAVRRADNAWGQIGVIACALLWLILAWLARVPAAGFWVVVLTGLVDRESFFKLALALHPDAVDPEVIALFCIGTALMAAALALWCQMRVRKGPPWKSHYRADLQDQLRRYLGVPRAAGRWTLAPQRGQAVDDDAFSDTVPTPDRC